ncbi:MAG: type IV secretion system DNA-binding domain-containing protein [Candidatus Vogelbacteria bacterium]|nr:type IV secretion system DNA-binding domain-containing protein [Candidatus Vogelbacteria bacterium]
MEQSKSLINYFALTDHRGKRTKFGIKSEDRAKHVYIIGKTGLGKSTVLENMAVQDIQNGEGMAFIDPHGKSADLLLDFVPEERMKDVIYFAPFDLENPISFNVMEDVGKDKRHLVANGLMSAFKKIWPDVWSARMEYILGNTILALLEYPGSTLLGVNRMLSDKEFRLRVVANLTDPSVRSFWVDEFAKYNERYMQEAGDAIKNKIGQFTSNPLIRNIIGQPKSSFDLREAMDNRKILIVNLSKGRLGEQNADLLGGILITKIYLSAMSRANVGPADMKNLPQFNLFVDEFQSFVNESFADILAEARKYKLSLTIAHQYIEQMPEEVRDAVFGNVGTTIAFRVGPLDAEMLEKIFFPTFTKEDMVNLGFAQIYLTLMIDGVGSQPFSAVTLPPIVHGAESIRDKIIEASRQRYAKPREVVEKQINEWYEDGPAAVAKKKSEEKSVLPQKDLFSKVNKAPIDNLARATQSLPREPILPKMATTARPERAPEMAHTTPKMAPKSDFRPEVRVEPRNVPRPPEPKIPTNFSLAMLKNKTKDSGRNKGELKDLLAEIMNKKEADKAKEKKPEEPNKEPVIAESVPKKPEQNNQSEVPKEVLESLLKVD